MKKFTSAVLAFAMLISATLCSASAADTGVQKARHAGETTEITVIEVDPVTNEQRTQVVEVAIPAGASAQEEQDIMVNAAKVVTGNATPQTRASNSTRATNYVELTSAKYTYVGMAYPDFVDEYSAIYVTFTGIEALNGASQIWTRVIARYNGNGTPEIKMDINSTQGDIVMVYGGRYGGATFYPSVHDNINVWSRPDVGKVNCNVTVRFS